MLYIREALSVRLHKNKELCDELKGRRDEETNKRQKTNERKGGGGARTHEQTRVCFQSERMSLWFVIIFVKWSRYHSCFIDS